MRFAFLLKSCVSCTAIAAPVLAADDVIAGRVEPGRVSVPDDFSQIFPGQHELASARPPAKAYRLIYAAAIDQYAIAKRTLLDKEPVLKRMVYLPFVRALDAVRSYDSDQKYSAAVDPPTEAAAVEHFLATGYDGKSPYEGNLRKEIEEYAAELRRSGDALTRRNSTAGQNRPNVIGPALDELKPGLLPGQEEVENTRRQAAKLDYVLYAASLEDYALSKAELLKREPVLDKIVKKQLRRLTSWMNSGKLVDELTWRHEEKLAILRVVLAKGYNGEFRASAEAVIRSGSGLEK